MGAPVGYRDLLPGARFRSTGRTLTEADHGLFMMLSGDWHPIHADAEFAKQTPAGQRMMHGSFGIALAMGMQAAALEFADPLLGALGLKEWSFRRPLFIGDTVHVAIEILVRRPTSDGQRYVLERRLSLVRHNGAVVQDGIATALLRLPEGESA